MTVSFPPDTDTPGYVEENRDKPQETNLRQRHIFTLQPYYKHDLIKVFFFYPVAVFLSFLEASAHLLAGYETVLRVSVFAVSERPDGQMDLKESVTTRATE